MENRSPVVLSIAVIIVGVSFSIALWAGLTQIAESVRHMPVAGTAVPTIPPTAVALSPTRFAVVREYSAQVFELDAGGHLRQLDDIDPRTLRHSLHSKSSASPQ